MPLLECLFFFLPHLPSYLFLKSSKDLVSVDSPLKKIIFKNKFSQHSSNELCQEKQDGIHFNIYAILILLKNRMYILYLTVSVKQKELTFRISSHVQIFNSFYIVSVESVFFKDVLTSFII